MNLLLNEVINELKDELKFKKMKNKPKLKFYCIKCNLFFDLEGDIPINDVKCPNCNTLEILIELNFESDVPNYFI